MRENLPGDNTHTPPPAQGDEEFSCGACRDTRETYNPINGYEPCPDCCEDDTRDSTINLGIEGRGAP